MNKETTQVITPQIEKIEKLERYVKKVEGAFDKLTSEVKTYGQLSYLSEQDIQRYLTSLPDIIADSNLLLSEVQRGYDICKIDTAILKAELWRESIAEKDTLQLTNAKDREAYVLSNPRYVKAQQLEVEWKFNLSRIQTVVNRYEDKFKAVRKLANLIEKDNENVYRREQYSN